MNKKDCNIVLDLLPLYIENAVTNDTREFIEEHIKNCSNCEKTLNMMKMDIVENEDKLKNDTEIEIEKIKKVNRNLKTHKIILVVSSIIILIIASILLSNAVYNKFNKTLYDNIEEIYNENIKLNNYHLTKKYIYKNYFETGSFEEINDIYYKEGKFKLYETFAHENADLIKTIKYGEINSDEIKEININDNTEVIKKSHYVDNEYILNDIGYYANLEYFKNINYEDVEIKNYENEEWYVYKRGNETNYNEYWINKNNLNDIRLIENDEKFYRETIFTIEKNIVIDEDIK